MEDQVPQEVVKDRFDRLLALVQEIGRERSSRFLNTVQEVLVEEKQSSQKGYVTGRMMQNLLVHFPGEESLVGKTVRVKLKECKGFYYIGEQE